ncbi:hypothetical protein [Halarcobacter anaerophilus]|uniref:hypothetical protein n=1 Tax=Halarcobacter anaerophilus TaxID=877500 RepID=UPI0005CADD95|nr:hypothetical protein [Halarcobacter anaerophilus]
MKTRLDLIKECYGRLRLHKNIVKKTRSGEHITAWQIDGIKSTKQLEETFSDEQILIIYDSGL